MKEDMFITAGRDLNTTLSSSFLFCILFAIDFGHLIKLEFLVQQIEPQWMWNK